MNLAIRPCTSLIITLSPDVSKLYGARHHHSANYHIIIIITEYYFPKISLWLQGRQGPVYHTQSIPNDDVIKWKHFPHYWPFVRGIHRSPVNSPHKGQWRGALMFSLIRVWINGLVNNREAGDLGRYRAHYDVIVMYGCTFPRVRSQGISSHGTDLIFPDNFDLGTRRVNILDPNKHSHPQLEVPNTETKM